jgi:hypothetical protein
LQILPTPYIRHNYHGGIPDQPLTIRNSHICEWNVTINQFEDSFYLTDGWEKVVDDMGLEPFDFIYFQRVGLSVFNMSVFSLDGLYRVPNQKHFHQKTVPNWQPLQKTEVKTEYDTTSLKYVDQHPGDMEVVHEFIGTTTSRFVSLLIQFYFIWSNLLYNNKYSFRIIYYNLFSAFRSDL